MLYSGADLIRISGHQAERLGRLKPLDSVRPVESPSPAGNSLNQDTKNALLRFARFVNKEGAKKAPRRLLKVNGSQIPQGYIDQLEDANPESRSGAMINIYI